MCSSDLGSKKNLFVTAGGDHPVNDTVCGKEYGDQADYDNIRHKVRGVADRLDKLGGLFASDLIQEIGRASCRERV